MPAFVERAKVDQICVLVAGVDSGMYARLATAASEFPSLALIGPITSPVEVLDAAVRIRSGVVLLDLALGGAELVAEVRTRAPESRILVYSATTVDRIVRYLLHLGISGYVFEHIEPRALLVAIRTVASGGTIFSDAILRR